MASYTIHCKFGNTKPHQAIYNDTIRVAAEKGVSY